jgi:ABC-type cobalt transport system substrate-binding protein
MSRQTSPTLPEIVVKTIVTHTVTYFIMGLLALTLLDYAGFFADSSLNVMMRPTDDPWVMAGPLFQPLRGLLFGLLFYLLREPFFERKHGWLLLWFVLAGVGIFGTFGPAPGSIEGMLFTIFALWVHLRSLPEVLLQSLFLALILVYWVNHPQKKWLTWVMGIAFVILMSFPILGLLVGQPQ